MDLGNLIMNLKTHNAESKLHLAFGYYFPTCISSYRGDYSQIALNYTDPEAARRLFEARERNHVEGHTLEEPQTIGWWIDYLESRIGTTMEGYKGGNFGVYAGCSVYAAEDHSIYSQNLVDRLVIDHDTVYIETRRED